MIKKTSLLRYAAIGMASVGLAGVAAASTVSFDEAITGPDSSATVTLTNTVRHTHNNTNAVGVANFNGQEAESGRVSASHNTQVGGEAGDASGSGAAMNENSTETSVVVNNGGGGGGAMSALTGLTAGDSVSFDGASTGADSDLDVSINNSETMKVNNTNVVQVENINLQSAQSGSVSAYKNTQAGGLYSGSAANSNSTVNSVVIGN